MVEAIDFGAWFADLALTVQDIVFVKVDIEGAEVPIMRRFVESAAFCIVDWWAVEWHPQFVGHILPAEKDPKGLGRAVRARFEARVHECNKKVRAAARRPSVVVSAWHR